ncbi:MAG: two-component system cell cycle sensor histidine kinase/response regulator CckA [Kangiellaceae bacterium]|jgi:two-component system cell cycle sensor histidine kinase/response regulator CckA
MNKATTQKNQDLHRRAEQLLDTNKNNGLLPDTPAETKQLLHELLVHQAELEMQNQELLSAQQHLVVSQARYFELYDLAPIGYLTFNKQRVIQECNLSAAAMIGVSRHVLIKAPVSNILLKNDQNIFYEKLEACIEKNFQQHFEIRLIQNNGAVFWALLQIIAMEAGEYWLTMTDISNNKRIEAELQESENKFRSIFEQAALGVARVSLDGTWLEVNNKLCFIVGYSQQELLSKTSQNLTHLEDLTMEKFAIRRLINDVIKNYTTEKRYYNRSGNIVWVNLTMSLVRDINNQPDYFIYIIEDISRQKNDEALQLSLTEQLHQAQKVAAIGNLAGEISHDFNNMLAIIQGQAEMAMSELEPNDAVIENLKAILKAANHSATLAHQLLIFAQKQTIERKVLNLNESVSAMVTMLERLISKRISLSWNKAENLWSVKVNPSQIEQILVNLYINAKDAIANVGFIKIKTVNYTVEKKTHHHLEPKSSLSLQAGNYVQISVRDNGSGMTNAVLERAFEPFFTTKKLGKGTGLGLSTVFGAVKHNGGFIEILSKPNVGTRVNVYFLSES